MIGRDRRKREGGEMREGACGCVGWDIRKSIMRGARRMEMVRAITLWVSTKIRGIQCRCPAISWEEGVSASSIASWR